MNYEEIYRHECQIVYRRFNGSLESVGNYLGRHYISTDFHNAKRELPNQVKNKILRDISLEISR
ncbi:hypothetical protein LBO01_18110 [Companilactobacillus paralimentarius]|jgi:hypothetical protein|uniref:Uncharacterized protein n=1 Tax=Companilactobacillus bobalius TaxID=2801451 RepID=A0A202F489_9LACO|nr:hypothetical protein ATN92_07705 [Companilactobacillus bobalius]OVE95263.1 hypothetical protein LKACC16343_02647 [Companilactobacillus bobalius]GEO58682.1 hypothetical protein LBO01_18110 [Companilactobacillus paralimentarius]